MSIEILETRHYAPGETVIGEGEESGEAYVIRSGTAEVLKRSASGREVLIARLDAGEIFGEMGLILERPRSATVRACESLTVDVVDPRSFTQLFENDTGRALRPFIQILCERLRVADARVVELDGEHATAEAHADEAPVELRVHLHAETPSARAALGGREALIVDRFPFRVGRQDVDPQGSLFHVNDLRLVDPTVPFRISRSHFAVVRCNNTCYFQDRGSKYGSLVNGKRVGGGYRNPVRVPLRVGRNSLQLGGKPAGLRFSLRVEKGEAGREAIWRKLRGYLRFSSDFSHS